LPPEPPRPRFTPRVTPTPVRAQQVPAAPPLLIRDVGPTSLQPGDTLVIECPGIVVGRGARVTFDGKLDGVAARLNERVVTAAGDRALLTIGGNRALQLTEATVEVTQGAQRWRLPPAAPSRCPSPRRACAALPAS
jgi:hypothetical protein